MSLAWIAIGALVLAVAISCTTAINVGVLSLAMAWLVGAYVGGMSLDDVLKGFPTPLLVTLIGVTLLFSIAECNGTLGRVTNRAVRLCGARRWLLPIVFFFLGLLVSTIGPGGTPSSALLAPPAMAVAGSAGIPPLIMAVMTGNGALAGTLSPFAPNGIIADSIMARAGLGGVEWQTYAYNALAHGAVALAGFMLLGGLRLGTARDGSARPPLPEAGELETKHWLTLAGIALLILAVTALGTHVGMTALAIAAALTLLRAVDEQQAIQRMPWGVILMVTGVTVLVSMVERAQGIELFTSAVARISNPSTVVPIVAFGTGVVSVYSSTSGVVMPAFLPMAPQLAERVGGLDPLRIAWSITVGGSLVDLSSLSTVGALFLAAAPAGTDARRLFTGLLLWGLSMCVVGAGLCWVLFG